MSSSGASGVPDRDRWLTPGVAGIGVASLFSDLGHEIATSVLPSFLSTVLGAPAAALGLIEGIADALSGAAKFAGGALPANGSPDALSGSSVTRRPSPRLRRALFVPTPNRPATPPPR